MIVATLDQLKVVVAQRMTTTTESEGVHPSATEHPRATSRPCADGRTWRCGAECGRTALSRIFARVFSVLKRVETSLVTLRQPQGGSTLTVRRQRL